MAIFRMFADIVSALNLEELTSASLDKIACAHAGYAYYGNRRTLKDEIRRRVVDIRQRNKNCSLTTLPDDDETLVQEWFQGRNWEKDSGSFPDFVLEYTGTGLLGDGAIIELKDSKGGQIASFNSTITGVHEMSGEILCLCIVPFRYG